MKQDEGKTNEVEANPYNRKKYWHTDDVMPKTLVSADSGPAEPDPEKKTGFDYATNTTTDSITVIDTNAGLEESVPGEVVEPVNDTTNLIK